MAALFPDKCLLERALPLAPALFPRNPIVLLLPSTPSYIPDNCCKSTPCPFPLSEALFSASTRKFLGDQLVLKCICRYKRMKEVLQTLPEGFPHPSRPHHSVKSYRCPRMYTIIFHFMLQPFHADDEWYCGDNCGVSSSPRSVLQSLSSP
jgi:hypothetical protein